MMFGFAFAMSGEGSCPTASMTAEQPTNVSASPTITTRSRKEPSIHTIHALKAVKFSLSREQPSMGITHKRKTLAFAMPTLLFSSLMVGDCTPAGAASSLMDARAQAEPPKKSIFDPPPQRDPAMTLDERQKMQNELNAARDRQTPNAKAKAHPGPSAQPAKP
jgi:hypothetical protein